MSKSKSLVNINKKGMSSRDTVKSLRHSIFLFQILALTIVLFIHPEVSYIKRIIFTTVLVVGITLVNFLVPKIAKGDVFLILIATFMFSIGSIMIYRLDPSLAIKQTIWLGIGLFAFFITYFVLKFLKVWHRLGILYFSLILVLFVVTLVFGSVRGGAQNWIVIGGENGITLQPSEFIKIILVFLISYYYSNYEDLSQKLIFGKKLGKYALMFIVYFFIGLLFIQAELGTAMIFYILLICFQFIYEEDKKQMIANLVLAIFGSLLGYKLFNHIRVRISIWMDPWKDINDTGYQITQSLFAIASGGFFGTGIGMGKPQLIPRSYTDFIFSAIVEEMGMFAGIGLIMMFLILVYRGFKISISQKNRFFSMVALGISITFAAQAFIIFGGVTKLIPLTGITIPFVTYGGSSVLASFISLAVLQFCSTQIKEDEVNDK